MGKNKVIVDRKKWFRGLDDIDSALVVDSSDNDEDNGKRCCLGFACNQLEGIPYNQLEGIRMPYNIEFKKLKNPLLTDRDTLNEISAINDDLDISDEYRESQLQEKFSERGVELEFVN